mmetsp:Transcript_90356/g.170352  ORF Transcript_90356/g.170352 Transcript_90356/m.170352 type:complete len:288 (-) Transcript_90356:82-945(-)
MSWDLMNYGGSDYGNSNLERPDDASHYGASNAGSRRSVGSMAPMTATERKLSHELIELREEHNKVKMALESVQEQIRDQHYEIKAEVHKAFNELSGFIAATAGTKTNANAKQNSQGMPADRPSLQLFHDTTAGRHVDVADQDFAGHEGRIQSLEERMSDNAAQIAKLKAFFSQQEDRVQAWVNAMREAVEVKIADINSKVASVRQTMLREVNHFSLLSALDTTGNLAETLNPTDAPDADGNVQASTSEYNSLQQRYHERLGNELQKVRMEMREASEVRKKAASSTNV